VSFQPNLPHGLEPRRREDLDVFPAFGDIAVFGAVGAANDEVRNVRSKVEFDGCAQVCANVTQVRLLYGSDWTYVYIQALTRCSGAIEVQHSTAPLRGLLLVSVFCESMFEFATLGDILYPPPKESMADVAACKSREVVC
jgi:hypothetical protein